MSVLSEQNVFRFDIAIDDVVLVEVGEPQEYFDDVEPGNILSESFVFLDEPEEFASRAVLDNEDEKVGCFEGELHVDEEGMAGAFHDVPLVHDDVFLLILHDDILIDHFHRIEVAVFFEPAQKDL